MSSMMREQMWIALVLTALLTVIAAALVDYELLRGSVKKAVDQGRDKASDIRMGSTLAYRAALDEQKWLSFQAVCIRNGGDPVRGEFRHQHVCIDTDCTIEVSW